MTINMFFILLTSINCIKHHKNYYYNIYSINTNAIYLFIFSFIYSLR